MSDRCTVAAVRLPNSIFFILPWFLLSSFCVYLNPQILKVSIDFVNFLSSGHLLNEEKFLLKLFTVCNCLTFKKV